MLFVSTLLFILLQHPCQLQISLVTGFKNQTPKVVLEQASDFSTMVEQR